MRLKSAVAAILAMFPAMVLADTGARFTQFHFRAGRVSGGISGAVTGEFEVMNAIDMDYEIFSETKRSFVMRATLANDFNASRLVYAYAGAGKRFYFKSVGASYESSEGGNRVVTIPKRRYFAGADLGISQVVVKTFGPILQASSALFDIGVNAGAIFQISKSVGLELQAGLAYGIGFSSVSVKVTTTRLLGGVSYFF